jgi:hypothetical protein
MSLVRCKDCGLHFERAADEAWKVRCIPCFKKIQAGGNRYRLIATGPTGRRRLNHWRQH